MSLDGVAACGQLQSSVRDLARWLAFQCREDGGPRGGAQVLSGRTLTEMHRPAVHGTRLVGGPRACVADAARRRPGPPHARRRHPRVRLERRRRVGPAPGPFRVGQAESADAPDPLAAHRPRPPRRRDHLHRRRDGPLQPRRPSRDLRHVHRWRARRDRGARAGHPGEPRPAAQYPGRRAGPGARPPGPHRQPAPGLHRFRDDGHAPERGGGQLLDGRPRRGRRAGWCGSCGRRGRRSSWATTTSAGTGTPTTSAPPRSPSSRSSGPGIAAWYPEHLRDGLDPWQPTEALRDGDGPHPARGAAGRDARAGRPDLADGRGRRDPGAARRPRGAPRQDGRRDRPQDHERGRVATCWRTSSRRCAST